MAEHLLDVADVGAAFERSENADALVMALVGLLSLAFVCIPFIPGLKTLPRHLRLYRAIWRDHYREVED